MSEQHRRQEELARARRQFADAVARGQLTAIDRFGNRLEVGQRIMVKTDIDVLFDIVAITPELSPQAPPGLLNVTVTTTFPLLLRAGVPNNKVHIIGVKEPVHAPAGSDNGNQATGPTLVRPGSGEAGEPAEVQADSDVRDRPDPEDDPPS